LSNVGVIEEISIAKIRHPKNQFRMNLDNLNELAESIKQHGLLQPIVIRPMQHVYEVVAGNRRFAATKLLGLRKISCHVIDLSDKEAYEVALVENVQQKTMNPIEDAIAFSRYVESYGWGGVTDLSRRIGKSQEFVTRRIQLLKLPQRIQEEIMRRRISPSVALEILQLDKDAVEDFADFVIKNPLTRNEIRHIVSVSKSNVKDDNNQSILENKKSNSTAKIVNEEEVHLLDRALRKSIAVMKSTLLNFDDIVNNVHDDWVLKELLMQYRLIIHGDIDTFLKLRKRLISRIPKGYFSLTTDRNNHVKSIHRNDIEKDPDEIKPLHLWATKGIWQ
jgi:ParB family transcriptional regulator, chromosome partitioning protein